MKSSIIIYNILLLLLVVGCSKTNVVSSNTDSSNGSVSFKIDKTNAPADVVAVIAYLSRENYETFTGYLNLLSDSTADISFQSIPIGAWHLKVDAINKDSITLYTGESDINIEENVLKEVHLILTPTGSGTGSVYIYVSWEDQKSNWTDFINNPIVTKDSSTYDEYGVGSSFILMEDNEYKMWYAGIGANGSAYGYYAYSADGLTWIKYSEYPILYPDTQSEWDSHHVAPGPVIKENGIYKMYYSGWKDQYGIWPVGLATSSDGIHWEKYNGNPVLSGKDWDYAIRPQSIVKRNGIYYLFYTGGLGYNCKIGVATSQDGYNWERYSGNPIMTYDKTWEGSGVGFPSVIYENDQFEMVYQGSVQQTQSNTGFGFAFSKDGFNWVKNSSNPFFSTADCNNNWLKISFPSFIKIDNESRIYYTGIDFNNSNWSICVTRKLN